MDFLSTIGYIVIPLLLIDAFYISYTTICKYKMRRSGIDEADINKVRKPWIIICFVIYTIIAIISTFIFRNYYNGSFIENLESEILVILMLCLMTYAGWSVIMHIKHFIGFTKDTYTGIKDSKKEFDNIADKFKDNGNNGNKR